MILVDTHVVLWLALEPDKLSKASSAELVHARTTAGGVAISDVVLWEIVQAVRKERVVLESSLSAFLSRVETTYRVLPINARTAERGRQFSARYPKDPFDRIIGATAIVHGLALITADRVIRASGEVPCIW